LISCISPAEVGSKPPPTGSTSQDRSPITHPEFYYGFVGVTVARHVLFLLTLWKLNVLKLFEGHMSIRRHSSVVKVESKIFIQGLNDKN
jgi:hypothetical protein